MEPLGQYTIPFLQVTQTLRRGPKLPLLICKPLIDHISLSKGQDPQREPFLLQPLSGSCLEGKDICGG